MSSSEQSIVSDDERDDLEQIIENDGQGGDDEINVGVENENKENEDEEKEEKRVVKPKRVVKNPRPKLNVDVLRGPKGLSCLENYFKNVKYKGVGHEAEDLRTIMKTYEYWCHRLFPKYPFDQCLEKIEKLGSKNTMQTFLKRIRLGMEDFGTSKAVVSEEEDEMEVETNRDFDSLVSQQQQVNKEEQLTEEQLERIRINRERAERIRMERLQKMQAKADALITESNILEKSDTVNEREVSSQENNENSNEVFNKHSVQSEIGASSAECE